MPKGAGKRYSGNQMKIARVAPPRDKITGADFKGLKNGDKWCLCVSRWIEAYKAGYAPKIILESTNIKTLEYITFEELLDYKF